MVFFVLGTKAQLIKIAPVMNALSERNLKYIFIFTGQHKNTIDDIRKNFNVKEPDITLYSNNDVSSIARVIPWLITLSINTLKEKKRIASLGNTSNIVLTHGDTFSTIAGVIIGKLIGATVGHIEAGLRSHNVFHPFPEEMIRIITSRYADVYFCPGSVACNNLADYSGDKIDTGVNTMFDALQKADSHHQSDVIPSEPYALVSMHRFENIFSKEALSKRVEEINSIAESMRLLFIMHEPTKKRLESTGLIHSFSKQVELRPRYDFFTFNTLLRNAEFVVTDGGSNQEECAYLGIPCLLLRKATERDDGLGATTVISKYDNKLIREFVNNYKEYRRKPIVSKSPSKRIVDYLEVNGYTDTNDRTT